MAKLKGAYTSGAPLVEGPAETEIEEKVRKALEKRGYELPSFKNEHQRASFVEEHGYDPKVVINSTVQMAKVFSDWRQRIQPAPKPDEDEEE